jgi:hypothetical protein
MVGKSITQLVPWDRIGVFLMAQFWLTTMFFSLLDIVGVLHPAQTIVISQGGGPLKMWGRPLWKCGHYRYSRHFVLSYGKITDIGTNHFPVVDWFRINCGLISCNVVRCGLPFPWFGVVDPRFTINMFEGALCTKKIGVYTKQKG